jgi:hypothetical protein
LALTSMLTTRLLLHETEFATEPKAGACFPTIHCALSREGEENGTIGLSTLTQSSTTDGHELPRLYRWIDGEEVHYLRSLGRKRFRSVTLRLGRSGI